MRRFPIRRPNWPALTIVCAAISVAAVAHAESLPYEAQITVPGAPVHSGPGAGFYITDTLAEGQTIEVHRHRDNGWYAIRPPENSFSWIYSAHVKLLEDSLAEIDKDDVPSRIGSRLSQRRNAVQVRLKKGEVVEIVGEAEEGGQKWYKIAPPAGEFRWIHASSIGHGPTSIGAPDAATEMPIDQRRPPLRMAPAALPSSSQPIITISANDPRAASATAPLPATNEWRAVPVAPPLTPLTPTTPPTKATDSDATAASTSPTTAAIPTTPPTPITPIPSDPITPITPQPTSVIPVAGSLDRQLTDIELRLSRMVAEPPAAWQITALSAHAEQLLSQAQTVSEREAVKVTLAKLDRFAAIARQYQQVPPAAQASQTPIAATENGRFDAVGVLRPVHSKRPGAPQFALIDERGQVVTFVTAPPEVNLQPYIGQRVGVAGNRGFIPEFRRNHVMAGRVTPLGQNLIR